MSFPTTLGIDAFAHLWPNVSLYVFPPIKLIPGSTMQSEGERCPSPSHSPILALPDLVLGANPPLVPVSLGDSGQAGLAVPASGQDLASSTRALEVVGMALFRGVASSQALSRGVLLEDICVAAGWSSPHTFVKFYNLDVDKAPDSQILSV